MSCFGPTPKLGAQNRIPTSILVCIIPGHYLVFLIVHSNFVQYMFCFINIFSGFRLFNSFNFHEAFLLETIKFWLWISISPCIIKTMVQPLYHGEQQVYRGKILWNMSAGTALILLKEFTRREKSYHYCCYNSIFSIIMVAFEG